MLMLQNNVLIKSNQLLKSIYSKGFFHLLSTNVLVGFLGFGSQMIVAKFLSPVELGQIRLMQSVIAIAIVVACYGFNGAILKICSEKIEMEEKHFVLKKSMKFIGIPISVTLVVVFILAISGLLSPDHNTNKYTLIYMFMIPASAITSLVMYYLQALKQIKLMSKVQALIRAVGLIFLIPATYFFGIWGFIAASLLANYWGVFQIVLLVYKVLTEPVKSYNGSIKRLLYFAKWNFLDNSINVIGKNIDILLINYFILDRANLGYYSLASIFIMALGYITSTIQAISVPYFSEKSGEKLEFMRVLVKYEKLIIIVSFVISLAAFFTVPYFMNIFYGAKYAEALILFKILVFRHFFSSSSALLGNAIMGLGKFKFNALQVFINVLLSAIITYLAIAKYGVMGVAIAQVLSALLTLVVMIIITKYVLRIHFG